jgi:hypothetical protein
MDRTRMTSRPVVAVAAAALGSAAVLATATSAMAGGSAKSAVQGSTASVTNTETCEFPSQKLKVSIALTLRSATDNDLTKIKVRATSKSETGSFYKKTVTLKSIKITTQQVDGDAVGVGTYNRTASPAGVTLDPKTTGSEIDNVLTVTKFKFANGATATATCSVSISD